MTHKILLFTLLALVLGFIALRKYKQIQAGIYGMDIPDQTGMDTMDVYQLTMSDEPVFTTLKRFVGAFGLPPQAKFMGETYDIVSRQDLDRLTEQAEENGYELYLCYKGFEMNYFHGDARLVISTIDLRESGVGLVYGDRTFDRNFTESDFGNLFPTSYSMNFLTQGMQSLFELNTGEGITGTESYLVERHSVDDPYARPTVEFTFKDGRLIYIFFANF